MYAVASSNPLSSAFCIGNSGICSVSCSNPACSHVAFRGIACRITVDTEKIARLLNTKGTPSESRNSAAHRLRNKAVRNANYKRKPRDVFEEDSGTGFKASFEDYIKVMDDIRRNRENKQVEESKQNLTVDDRVDSKEKRIVDERINLKANLREEESGIKDFKADFRFSDFDTKSPRASVNAERRIKRVAVEVKATDENRSASLKREELKQLRAELVNSKAGDMSWLLDGDMDAGADGRIETQRKAFQFCKDTEFRPPMDLKTKVEGLAQLLNNTDVKMPEWHFSKLMHSAKMKFTDHSILCLVQCLGNMGNWRRALQVVQWLHGRQRYNHCKSRYVYTTVLAILGKANKPVEALNVFHAMREDFSTYPDMPAYHSIAVTLGQAGHIKELLDVMDCLQVGPEKKLDNVPLTHWDPRLQPDVVVYNAVINACVQRKDCHGAIWVLQQMRLNGICPSSATYGLVMEVMLKSGKYDLVHKFYEKMKKSGWIPNMLTYKVLIQAFREEGKINEIVATVKEMERQGIVGSAGLYYRFACCLCSAGKFQDALLQIEKIRRVANRPLYVTYTGLIQACIESGHLHDGISIFHHMQNFCAPNIVTCNIMMKLYGQNNMFEEAKSLFQEIIKGRIGPQRLSSNDRRLTPDIFTYNAMLEACVAAQEWDYFEIVYQKMLRHGYQFDNKQHVWLVVAASKAGKGHLLDKAFDQLVELGKIPHVSLYKEQICQSLQAREYAQIINYIRVMKDAQLNISENGWVKLFKKNANRISQENLQELLHEVNSFMAGNDQGNHILTNLINSLQHMSELSVKAETTAEVLMEEGEDVT